MKSSRCRRLLLLSLLFANGLALAAKPREAEWKKVDEATENDQPQTAIRLLKPIEAAAFADHAWAEGAKALAMRLTLEGKLAGDEATRICDLAESLATSPAAVRPFLRLLHARWLFTYYQNHYWKLEARSSATDLPSTDLRTWDASRMLDEIDRGFQASLADAPMLQAIPVAGFETLLEPAELGDNLRPTLYDFIAHSALQYYALEGSSSKPQGTFEIPAVSPALDASGAFLAWHPQSADPTATQLRALRLYQDLLNFHKSDKDPSALLHCDLERIRWAGRAATGPTKPARLDAALRAFIAANATHPLSAAARQDVAEALIKDDKTKDARDFAGAGADAFPEHPFGKLCQNIVNFLEAKHLAIKSETHWTGSTEELTIEHANLSRVWFRAVRREWAPGNDTLARDPEPADLLELKKLLDKKPALIWDIALPDAKDFRVRLSFALAPEHLAPGYYLIVASASEDFAPVDNQLSYLPVHVTDLALVLQSASGNRLKGSVTDAVSGAPRAGIPVAIWKKAKNAAAITTDSTTTDADGQFSLSSAAADDAALVAAGGHDNYRIWRLSPRDDTSDPPQKTVDHIIFFTDRPIYRPGQTVHFKGIWSREDLMENSTRVVAGEAAAVTLSDYDFRSIQRRQIQQLDVVSNEFGSFSGSFTAPAGLGGEYQIAVKDLGETSIRVEEYKRPKFFVKLKPPQAPVAPGATAEAVGQALAYTGGAVDGAKVTWRVTRSTSWQHHVDDAPAWPNPSSPSKEIAHGDATTAADGRFSIGFSAEADANVDPQTDPVYSYDINVEVTEPSGETRSASSKVRVAYTTLKAGLAAESWLEEGKPVVFKVLTQTHSNQGCPAEGVLRIYQLKEPRQCPRGIRQNLGEGHGITDADAIDTIDTSKWELGKMLREIPVTTGKENTDKAGMADVSTALPAGIYRAVFTAKDANGRLASASCGIQVVNPDSDRFPTNIPFFAEASVTKAEPGQPVSLLWGSGYPTARACFEVYKDGTLLKREWSAPNRTQQLFTFTPDESMRGGITVRVMQTTMNRLRQFARTIEIPWTNKDLKLRWEHLTSKLAPGAKDTWTASVTDANGHLASAEMLALLYDASLNAITPYPFPQLGYLFREEYGSWANASFNDETSLFKHGSDWNSKIGFGFRRPYRECLWIPDIRAREGEPKRSDWGFGDALPSYRGSLGSRGYGIGLGCAMASHSPLSGVIDRIAARKNLQETAFFYPFLTSDDKGEVRITFTMPEALTQWQFLGFAHDKDMRFGSLVGETVTAKDLMVQPNPPRFLREGDVLDFTVKITNQSAKEQAGTARLTLCDAATRKDATAALGITAPDQPWTIPAKESRTLTWHLTVPDVCGVLTYKALATSGTLSDGEEGWLPVIPRRVMLTESMALPIRDASTKDYTFQKLLDSGKSTTLENRLVQVQVVSQPAWHAVLALPYLMEFPHQCAEQTFNRYYANALARHIAQSDPKIRRVFDSWKDTPALDSPLAKDADIKGILLEETPWLTEATEQSQARRKLGLLFDDKHLAQQLETSLKMLDEMQGRDGLWPWFPGGQGNEKISLYIATGFARLRALGAETDIRPALSALTELDIRLTKRFAAIRHAAKKDPATLQANHLDAGIAHFLYARTFFLKDRAIKPEDKQAFEYFSAQAKQYWPSLDARMSRAHVALALACLGDTATARLITRSLRENAVTNEETGMSWNDGEGEGRWYWWQAPIETQAMMIEAFREIDHDAKAVDACQVWLIKQKQVHEWHSTKATADAICVLLMGGRELLGSDALLQVSLGGTPVKPEGVEPGTGFYEARFTGTSIKPEMGAIQLTKTDPGVAWASISWQHLEDMAKVTEHNGTALKLEKALFVRHNSSQGPKLDLVTGPVKVGDELVTRLVLRNDRAMEFVHLKDMRGSGTEPVNVLSGYRWQDGFGYYEETRDTASHFFIDTLPSGTHVFESSVRVQHVGIYQTGVAEIRCMYAPEFSAHSASIRLEVGQ